MAKFVIETEIESDCNIGDVVLFAPKILNYDEYENIIMNDGLMPEYSGIGVIVGVGLDRSTKEIQYQVLSNSFDTTGFVQYDIKDYNIIDYVRYNDMHSVMKIAEDYMTSPEEVDKMQYKELHEANETAQRVNAI